MTKMTNTHKTPLIGSAMLFTLALASAVGCGSNSGKTSDPNGTTQKKPAASQQSTTDEINQALNSQAGQAYLAAAQNGNGNGPICQTELKAMEDAIQGVASNPNQGFDAISQAVQAFASCIQAQVPNLPGMPIPGTSCMASVQNGNVVTTGDCGNCSVTQSGTSVSVQCSSGTGTGTGTGTNGGTTNPNITIPSNPNMTIPGIPTIPIPDPTNPNGVGTGTGTGACMANVVNGQLMQTGDCSHCQIKQDNGSVSVSCQQSN